MRPTTRKLICLQSSYPSGCQQLHARRCRAAATGKVALSAESRRRLAARKVLRRILWLGEGREGDQVGAENDKWLQAMRLQAVLDAPQHWRKSDKAYGSKRPTPRQFAHAELSKDSVAVPDIERASEMNCHLTLRPFALRFADPSLNAFLAKVFQEIVDNSSGKVRLSRFDLFHGHLFVTRGAPHGLGILFHTAEYPARSKSFDIDLGFCQLGSTLAFEQRAFDFRNWLYFKDRLVSLDAGSASILHDELLMEGLEPLRTMLESDFGVPLAELYFFPGPRGEACGQNLFVCPLHA